jgi:hypothetical protein
MVSKPYIPTSKVVLNSLDLTDFTDWFITEDFEGYFP